MSARPRIKAYMCRDLVTLTPEIEIRDESSRRQSHFRRFPVMSEGRLVGQISRSDLLKALAGNWQ